MIQPIEMSHQEKVEMYRLIDKEKLIEMLIESNNVINQITPKIEETVTDIDGNVYKTVNINGRLWMEENLRVTHYNDGSPIPLNQNEPELGSYFDYKGEKNQLEYIKKYGYLYNEYAIETKRLAPVGWHVATDEEMNDLKVEHLKNHLGGYYSPQSGSFYGVGYYGYWWSSTEYSTAGGWSRLLGYGGADVNRSYYGKTDGFSARCVKDY